MGGEQLPIPPGEQVDLVRALNLLRGAHPDDVDEAIEALAQPLRAGGWLIEGSTDTEGQVGVFRVLERHPLGLCQVALIVTTNFGRGFDPRLFTAWLPRGLGRHARPAPSLQARFQRWSEATAEARSAGAREPARTFAEAARRLAEVDSALVVDTQGWASGVMWWREAHGSVAADPAR